MKLKIYTESYNKQLFQAVYFLEKQGRLEVETISSRFLSNLYLKIKRRRAYSPLKSFIAPFKLLFYKNIVLAFAPYSNSIYYMCLLKLLNKKIIYHTSWPYWNGKKYVKKPNFITKKLWELFLKNTKTICCTKKVQEELNKLGALAYHIPHSVDTSLFKQGKKEKLRILYVGRINKEKGILSILNIIKKINKKDIIFTFVGKGELENLLNNKDLPIEYLGFINNKEELAKIYSKSSVFILNSYSTKTWEELFGIVLIEAMASGLPIVSTNCIGPRELIENGKNGYLINQKDENALMNKLNILIKDKKLRENMGKYGRNLTIKKYDINKIANDWMNLIKK